MSHTASRWVLLYSKRRTVRSLLLWVVLMQFHSTGKGALILSHETFENVGEKTLQKRCCVFTLTRKGGCLISHVDLSNTINDSHTRYKTRTWHTIAQCMFQKMHKSLFYSIHAFTQSSKTHPLLHGICPSPAYQKLFQLSILRTGINEHSLGFMVSLH